MLNQIKSAFGDSLLRVAFIGIAMVGFIAASIAPFRSIIGIEIFGLSEPSFATLTAIGAIITVTASIFIGIFNDQTGRYKDVLMICLFIGFAGCAILYFFPTKRVYILVSLVFLPVSATAMSQFFSLAKIAANQNKNLDGDFASAIARAALSGAFALTPPIWAILIMRGTNLMTIFAAAAATSLLLLLIVYFKWPAEGREASPKQGQKQAPKQDKVNFSKALKELSSLPLTIRLVLVSIINSLGALNATLAGLIIINELAGTKSDVGWFIGSVAFCEIPIMILSPLALRYMNKATLIFIGVLIFGGYLCAYHFLPSIKYLWWLIIPASLGGGIFLALVIGYVQDLVSDKPGTGGALISLITIGGQLFCAAIFGVFTAFFDYSGTAIIGALFAIFAAFLLVAIDSKAKGSKIAPA